MKKLNYFLVVLLAMMLSVGSQATAVEYGEELQNAPEKTYSQKFSDVPSKHWAFAYIGEMVERGVLNGYPDGTFRPDNAVSRAEFAKIMVSAAGLTATATSASSFSDIPTTNWSSPFVETAKTYLTGFTAPDGSLLYKPNAPALREDIAVALVKLKGYDTSIADFSMIQAMFKDYDSISESAKRYVAVAVERGLISGYPDETFRGQAGITRAEASALLWRAYQYGSDNKVTELVSAETTPAVPEEQLPTLTAAAEEKPYQINTLLKANVSDASHFTYDDEDNLYYLNHTTNKVVRFSIAGKTSSEYFDIKKIDVDTEEITMSDFQVSNILYNNYADKLIIQGNFQNINPPQSGYGAEYYTYEYSPRGGLVEVSNSDAAYRHNKALSNGSYHSTREVMTQYIVNDGFASEIPDYGSYLYAVSDVVEMNGAIVMASDRAIWKYDFSNLTKVTDTYGHTTAFQGNTIFSIGYGGFYRYNFNGKVLAECAVSDIKVNDLHRIDFDSERILRKLVITQNQDIVFYDRNAGAFRMISEN